VTKQPQPDDPSAYEIAPVPSTRWRPLSSERQKRVDEKGGAEAAKARCQADPDVEQSFHD